MRPSVASGLSCQRSTGISKSQSLYCSPGYNGHMELWSLSRSLLWTSEKVTKVWHTCECGLNSFFPLSFLSFLRFMAVAFSYVHHIKQRTFIVMTSSIVIWLQWDITVIYYNYTLFIHSTDICDGGRSSDLFWGDVAFRQGGNEVLFNDTDHLCG